MSYRRSDTLYYTPQPGRFHWPAGDVGGMLLVNTGERAFPSAWIPIYDAGRGDADNGWAAYMDAALLKPHAGPFEVWHEVKLRPGTADPAGEEHMVFLRGKNMNQRDPLQFGYYAAGMTQDGTLNLWKKAPGRARSRVATVKLPSPLRAETLYDARFVVVESAAAQALRFKFWAGQEPTDWQILWEDTSADRLTEAAADLTGYVHDTRGIAGGGGGVFAPVSVQSTAPPGGVLDTNADEVWGQPDFATSEWNYPGAPDYLPTASNLGSPLGVLRVDGGMYVSDADNNRILFFPEGSKTATRVYGQPGFVSNAEPNAYNEPLIGPGTLYHPAGMAVDALGGLYVAEYYGDRVVYFPSGSTVATRVWGLPDLTSGSYNGNGDRTWTPAQGGLMQPADVALDDAGMYVADRGHSRVLFYPFAEDGLPQATPTRVYGQADLSGEEVNAGRGSAEDSPTADTLYCPEHILCDGQGGLYISDLGNNRVLHYPQGSTTPDRVYGQNGSFTRADGAYGYNLNNTNFYHPAGMALAPDGLWVVDGANGRILFFPEGSITATMVIGQSSFTARESAYPPTNASVNYAGGLFWDETGLYVADTDNNRILRFSSGKDSTGGSSGGTATIWYCRNFGVAPLLAQRPAGFEFTTQPGDGVAGRPLYVQPVVQVVDADDQLCLAYAGTVLFTPLPGDKAQISGNSGFLAVGGLVRCAGLGIDRAGTYQLVPSVPNLPGTPSATFQVDSAENATGMPAASDLWGQADFGRNQPNRGGAASNVTLANPQGVFVDADGAVWVADTGNNRVLYFPPGDFPHTASLVFGQPDLMSTAPGSGLAGLFGPTALYVSGDAILYVADTGNNRIVRWNKDTEAGTWPSAAALDIGTQDPTGGAGTTKIWRLSGPRGVAMLPGALFIADTGQHRVVISAGAGYIGSELYIGQKDIYTAEENYNPDGSNSVNALGLSRPTAIAANSQWLLVFDSGNHRVLGYPVSNNVPAMVPTRVWGQPAFGRGAAPERIDALSFGAGCGLALDATGFWVTDPTRNRALHFSF